MEDAIFPILTIFLLTSPLMLVVCVEVRLPGYMPARSDLSVELS